LGYQRPTYAHLPYVAQPGGTAKLSKRKLDTYLKNKDFADLLAHGQQIADACNLDVDSQTFNPVIIDFYREVGFLPAAILNYLLLLGWSLDGETEKFTVEQMVKRFTLHRVNKAPASFDPQKLMAFQADAFAALPPADRLALVAPFAQKAGFIADAQSPDPNLAAVVDAVADRLKVAGDIIQFGYCFRDDFEFDEKAFQKRIVSADGATDLLTHLAGQLETLDTFDAASAEAAVKQFCETAGIKLGQIIHALRVAITGQASGFGMFETLAVLGRDRTVQRMRAAVKRAATIGT